MSDLSDLINRRECDAWIKGWIAGMNEKGKGIIARNPYIRNTHNPNNCIHDIDLNGDCAECDELMKDMP